jgi:hypothetical protein
MPAGILPDYQEAAAIVSKSPRGAAALLRLCIQKLMEGLGAGSNLNEAIGKYNGRLDPHVVEAMDALRVIGNNAVHPLEMDLRDDTETAASLFWLINLVVDELIAKPKRSAEMFAKLPEGARKAIQKRNASMSGSE